MYEVMNKADDSNTIKTIMPPFVGLTLFANDNIKSYSIKNEGANDISNVNYFYYMVV